MSRTTAITVAEAAVSRAETEAQDISSCVTANAMIAIEPTSYMLPNILRDWPYEDRLINTYYRLVQAESVDWLESFRPFTPAAQKAFNKCDFSLFVAMIYPQAAHYDLRSCCDLMYTFFVLDEYTDTLDEEGTRIHCDACMDAILHPDKPRPEGDPLSGEITRQFWKRASANAPKATQEHFVKSWRSYLDSVIVQAQRRDRSRYICTIEEYIIARRDNIGCAPSFVFLEISLGLDIPHSVMEHPYISQLHQDVTDMIIFGNDLCSYKKEVLADDADYNAVTIIIKTNETDMAGAVQFISDTHDGLVERWLQLRDDILNKRGFPSFGEDLDRQIAVYIDGIGQLVRGHDEWTFASGRYFGEKGREIQKTRKVVIA